MEEGGNNGVLSDGVVKNRNSTGCLIIKKKADGAGGYSGPDIVYTRKEKKRPRPADSDSESSDDELLEMYRRRLGSNRVSTSGSSRKKKGIAVKNESARKRSVDFYQDDIFPPPERKRNSLDVYEFDEYDDWNEMGRGYFDTPSRGRMFVGSSGRGVVMGDRKRPYHESSSSEKIRSSSERFDSHSNEAIRLQGKNGVLKVMVKNKVPGSSVAKKYEEVEGSSVSRARESTPKKAMPPPSVYLEPKVLNDSKNVDGVKIGKRPRKPLPPKEDEDSDEGSEESEEPPSNLKTPRPTKRGRLEDQVTPKSKETKGKRGSGTEKQLLREKIRKLLLSAGWTIDLRPRRNRDYFDSVYINPAGTAYWSIIKAYDALQKQIEEDGADSGREKSGVSLISDDALSKLTRQTQKKMEKELKRKNKENNASKRKKKAAPGKFVDDEPETECTDSDESEDEEELRSYSKRSGNSKGRLHDFRNGKPSATSSHAIHGRKTNKIGRCTLLVRNADKELNYGGDSFTPYKGKRTILSWLVDSGIVKLSEKVLYMNRRRKKVMLDGWITREGIHCGCCSKILTVSKFEIHAGSKLRQPYQNICLPSGVSLLQCQVDAWNSQDEPQRTGFNKIDVDGDDPNDDTCGMCGDGGNLICCDGCPSTFHQSCLGIEMLPPGDWHCPHCSCKFCGLADVDTSQSDENILNELVGCSLCNRKYHKACIPQMDSLSSNSSNQISFCGKKCQELFERLQKLLGVKHDIESGLSWSLIHRNDLEADPSHRSFSQKVEWNAKLAVSLSVMVECFLPITDRRSGINLIQNVLYNCRSNFNRLNYGGFYTAVLERGDEIISAASIRIHGNQLAEMPYIGTRHIYRRQGMCRRLLVAIEKALQSLKVEKLIIPAISDMMHTWTNVFGFSALGDSQKLEMKSLNMLVFPGTDMLQKKLLPQAASNRDVAACTGNDLCKADGEASPLLDSGKSSDAEISPTESAGDPLPHKDLSVEKSVVHKNDCIVEKSDSGLNLQNSSPPSNADSFLSMGTDAPSGIQEPMECKVSQETGSLPDPEDKLCKSVPTDTVEVTQSGSEAVKESVVGIPDLASDMMKTSSLDATLSTGKPECDSPVENKVQALEVEPSSLDATLSTGKPECDSPIENKVQALEVEPSSLDATLSTGKPECDSPIENKVQVLEVEPSTLDATLSTGKPDCDSPKEKKVQALEVETGVPSENGDRIPETDFASKPLATSSTAVDPCLNDSEESKPLNESAELDSAMEDSIEPICDSSSGATLTPSVCSVGMIEHVTQAEEVHPDSSNSGNIQNHFGDGKHAGFEVKAADSVGTDEPGIIQTEEAKPDSSTSGNTEVNATEPNPLLQTSAVSSNGTSVPFSDNNNEPMSFSPVQVVDHSQTLEQLAAPVPATKCISSTEHESNGMQSCSSIDEVILKPDCTLENNSSVGCSAHISRS